MIRLPLVDLIKLVYSIGFLLTGIILFISGQLILNNTLYKEPDFTGLDFTGPDFTGLDFTGLGGTLGIIIQFIGIMCLFYGTLLSVIQIMCLLIYNNSKDGEHVIEYQNTLKFLKVIYIIALILPIIYILIRSFVHL